MSAPDSPYPWDHHQSRRTPLPNDTWSQPKHHRVRDHSLLSQQWCGLTAPFETNDRSPRLRSDLAARHRDDASATCSAAIPISTATPVSDPCPRVGVLWVEVSHEPAAMAQQGARAWQSGEFNGTICLDDTDHYAFPPTSSASLPARTPCNGPCTRTQRASRSDRGVVPRLGAGLVGWHLRRAHRSGGHLSRRLKGTPLHALAGRPALTTGRPTCPWRLAQPVDPDDAS